jgi:hypothetical protein
MCPPPDRMEGNSCASYGTSRESVERQTNLRLTAQRYTTLIRKSLAVPRQSLQHSGIFRGEKIDAAHRRNTGAGDILLPRERAAERWAWRAV